MFSWRFQLREARLAVADGRWDEAARLLTSRPLCEFLPAKRLSQQLASELVVRGRRRIGEGESRAGWLDLDLARQLGPVEDEVLRIRREQTTRRLQLAHDALEAGRPEQAVELLARLHQQGLGEGSANACLEIARLWVRAERAAAQGDFAAALKSLHRAERLLAVETAAAAPSLRSRLALRQTEWNAQRELLSQHAAALHEAMAAGLWPEVLVAAEAVLELAPQDPAARRAHRRAWEAVGLAATRSYAGPGSGAHPRGVPTPLREVASPVGTAVARRRIGPRASTRTLPPHPQEDTVTAPLVPGPRLIAWIDSVGGYLLCLGSEIAIGQPGREWGIDIPILGDLSRRHALLRRAGESYLLRAYHDVRVDGQAVTEPVILRNGALLQLGGSVRLRFRLPHALSHTAILDIESPHKTDPAVDGIVLMSESCILGPQSHSHIVCRNWPSDVVWIRRGSELGFRGQGEWTCNGSPRQGEFLVGAGDCIESELGAISLEGL